MQIEHCSFSGLKMCIGRGRRYVRLDGKLMYFLSHKTERNYFLKRNPREVRWTALYRKKYKKGQMEDDRKKKSTRKTTKFSRAIAGATLTEIMQKRNQTLEVRNKQRAEAIKQAKEKQKEKEKLKKSEKAAAAKKDKGGQQQQKTKISKPVQKSRPNMGSTR